ncbi:unnamed protein product [Boreogadus saida]
MDNSSSTGIGANAKAAKPKKDKAAKPKEDKEAKPKEPKEKGKGVQVFKSLSVKNVWKGMEKLRDMTKEVAELAKVIQELED